MSKCGYKLVTFRGTLDVKKACIAARRARREYEKECKAEGIEASAGFMHDLHFHDLRHEATSRLAEKLALHELMKVTGHKDTRMLAMYYHPRAEDLARKLG
ncbi:MAG: tyrosine-type recombinase/integrase [Sulfuricella sp.]